MYHVAHFVSRYQLLFCGILLTCNSATRVATAPQVEEQRRRAEQDKLAAIIDLERLSRDLLQEKKEKRKLEARIREMNSQLLVGGVVDTQVCDGGQTLGIGQPHALGICVSPVFNPNSNLSHA